MARIVSPDNVSLQPSGLRFWSHWQSISRGNPREGFFGRRAGVDLPGREHLERYLQYLLRRNCRRLTILQAFGTLTLFLTFLKRSGSRLERVSRRDLEAFVEGEQDRGLKLSSVRTKLNRVYAFLGFLIEEGIRPPEVLMRKIRLKVPEYLPRAMDPEDVRGLLSVIDNTRDRAMMLTLLRTGMRISELLALSVSDLDIKQRRIVIREGAKTHRGRVVYFSHDAADALKAWLRQRDASRERLFYAPARRSLGYTSARHMFNKYLERAGLAHTGYTLHCLRHTFASELLNAGMRLEYLQQLLGHESIQVTRHYARLTNNTLQREYFRAMARIERGEIDGTYRVDHNLQTILKAKKRLTSYRHKLFDEPQAVSPVAGGAS